MTADFSLGYTVTVKVTIHATENDAQFLLCATDI